LPIKEQFLSKKIIKLFTFVSKVRYAQCKNNYPGKFDMILMALDLGDAWTGIAITDPAGILARPLTTVATKDLKPFLMTTFSDKQVKTIIIGHPITMKGGESTQTKKIVAQRDELAKIFPDKKFILWDERLSSQRAKEPGFPTSKEEKMKTHARAAAFILDSYLTFLQAQKSMDKTEVDSIG
jgi:putative Holliday junction resolvase